VPGTAYGIYDQISRPDESESTNFINLDGSWHASDRLTFNGQVGFSEGTGKTPEQNVAETEPGVGNGASYTLHGVGSGPSWNLGDTNNTTPFPGGMPVAFGWIFGAQNVDVIDTEEWLKLDGTFKMNDEGWTDLKFGLRTEGHDRNSTGATAQGPTFGAGGGTDTANYPTTWQTVPANLRYLWRHCADRLVVLDARAAGRLQRPGKDTARHARARLSGLLVLADREDRCLVRSARLSQRQGERQHRPARGQHAGEH
jgi:hypothetical protein